MKNLSVNFQIPYFKKENSYLLALNLITFGLIQFKSTFFVANLNTYKNLCFNNTKQADIESIKGFLENHLIDCIRIHICFENFFKGIHLVNGAVIHLLDKNIFPSLAKDQKKKPIQLKQVLKQAKWEKNDNIQTPTNSLKLQIKGILKNTLAISTLTKKEYLSSIKFDREIYNILSQYLTYRNNLHYYIGETSSFNRKNYEDFLKIIDFTNKNIIRIQHELVDINKKEQHYKIPIINY